MAACGGGGGGSEGAQEPAATDPDRVTGKPATRAEAARFLEQATFGPTAADIDAVMAQGYGPWLEAQLALPATGGGHVAYWDARQAALKAAGSGAYQSEVLDAFWTRALSAPDQVRARVAFALSQIFVISMVDGGVGNYPRGAAGYLDMLNQQALGRYRDLLESVSLHPMMGLYLSHLGNQRESPKTGRVPDENYAREVMQLFSIGLHELNADGTPRLVNGQPVETYGQQDIQGMARVFTGFSWACQVSDDNCFFWASSREGETEVDRVLLPMRPYPQFHAFQEKRFLGVTVADQGSRANPEASLKTALDTLAAHPNVAPFLARQLIQRLVTSNPSTAYVGRAAAAFQQGGGDLKALVRAVLLDKEARDSRQAESPTFGRLREPVLRLSAFLRAMEAGSDSGAWLIRNTDDAGTALGMSPLRAPSVFNFYRPGYVPPGGALASAGLVMPEMQITHETSVVGYVNYMRSGIQYGFGQNGFDWKASRRDVQLAHNRGDNSLLNLVETPEALVEAVDQRLLQGRMGAALRAEIVQAVASIAIPVRSGGNDSWVDAQRRNRLYAALFLASIAPEFIVQK
ncbi:DUF1800 domain-containing protein [Ideonella sp. TBM-1]|uniref:DUF1800 domain-containing protein n=1 Tax=Ideonella livida TaxID=2707176 RepID=A0A7C9PH76_9BURK|nr:DUF1800 domain-containing protein [Ideonella livida]